MTLREESEIRDAVKRLQNADEIPAPDFAETVARGQRRAASRSQRRLIAIAAIVVCLLGGFWALNRSALRGLDSARSDSPQGRDSADANATDIDFDQLRRLVEQHGRDDAFGFDKAPIWSSSTESLLAVNLDISTDGTE